MWQSQVRSLIRFWPPGSWVRLSDYQTLMCRWIMRGFSGHFPPFQLLFLWDLVLAYDSMEVFPHFWRFHFYQQIAFRQACKAIIRITFKGGYCNGLGPGEKCTGPKHFTHLLLAFKICKFIWVIEWVNEWLDVSRLDWCDSGEWWYLLKTLPILLSEVRKKLSSKKKLSSYPFMKWEKVIWFVGIKERSDVILGVMACDVLPVAMFKLYF